MFSGFLQPIANCLEISQYLQSDERPRRGWRGIHPASWHPSGRSCSGFWHCHSSGTHPCGSARTNPRASGKHAYKSARFRINRSCRFVLSSCCPALCAGSCISIIFIVPIIFILSKGINQPSISPSSTAWASGGSQGGLATLAFTSRRLEFPSDELIQKDTNEKVPDKPAHLSKYAYGTNSNHFIRLRQVHMICPSFSVICSAASIAGINLANVSTCCRPPR